MPLYNYECKQEGCGHEFETYHSIKSDLLTECPECHNQTLRVIPYISYAFVKGEAKTLGMQAERNTQRLGTQGMQEMWAKAEERKQLAKAAAREELAARLPEGASLPTPSKPSEAWYRPGTPGPDMSLTTLTPQQTKKYIEEGTK